MWERVLVLQKETGATHAPAPSQAIARLIPPGSTQCGSVTSAALAHRLRDIQHGIMSITYRPNNIT
jgi:hypothetical protein